MLMGKNQKEKPLSSPMSVKAVRWKGWGLWWEGFKEKVSFEFRVEKSMSAWWTMTVVMMGQMSLDNLVEKSEKRISGLGRKFIPKARSCIKRNERSVIFKEEDSRVGNRRRRTSFNMRWVNRDQISEVARLSSKNFICRPKIKNFILNTLIDFEPV